MRCSKALTMLTTVALLQFDTGTAAAQDTALVAPGSRLRLRLASESGWKRGTLMNATRDSIRIVPCKSCTSSAYSFDRITHIEVSRGRSPRDPVVYASGLTGLVTGVALGVAHARRTTRNCSGGPCGLAEAFEPPLSGVAGLMVGMAFGVCLRFEDWRPALVR
jgi:hypothetical protein